MSLRPNLVPCACTGMRRAYKTITRTRPILAPFAAPGSRLLRLLETGQASEVPEGGGQGIAPLTKTLVATF